MDGPPVRQARCCGLVLSTLALITMGAWQGWAVLVALLAGLAASVAPLLRKPL